jgi:hypothetical protein
MLLNFDHIRGLMLWRIELTDYLFSYGLIYRTFFYSLIWIVSFSYVPYVS